MSRKWRIGALSLIITLHIITKKAFAQHIAPVDSLFKQAQELAKAGKYKNSRKLARQVISIVPQHTDAVLLIGRTFAWQNMSDSAKATLLPLIQQAPPNQEALLVLADAELWAGEPEQSLQFAETGQKAFPASPFFLLAKARALHHLKRYKEATEVVRAIPEEQPQYEAALTLLEKIIDASMVNRLRVVHQSTVFMESMSPWHLSSIEYTRLAPKAKFLARASYAQRYSKQSIQGELETYPQLTKNTYVYLNAGFSDNKLFPTYRAGAEVYQVLPFKIEASLGARTLFFPSETVVLYTGYLGKYFQKQWLSFRPYFQKQQDGWQTTGIVQLRQYLKHEDEYLTLTLAKGSTPYNLVGFEEISRLDAARVGMEGQFRLGKSYLAGGTLMYEQEEYESDASHNRITMGLSFQVKF
ncbi:YaiO family outer membrane beta-barrel protein [Pontibacter silvestris]|uniref:YaiO family outer membrane beta-barrel protein n=1 Tax=Pontibacter silvestris TaxID=2305183 RepID=A0ABW4X1U3_9BACT|nr:YaiO family outer membrane beta-barrel protein [Pontibacter silvestris]MCC9135075.1 YaiO family outer membrane beta-barrel protein [Pontibacter silvestris]